MGKRITVLVHYGDTAYLLVPFLRRRICGYEGGISSGEVPGKTTLITSEVTFVTGEPWFLKAP